MRRAVAALALAFAPMHPAWGQTMGWTIDSPVDTTAEPQELVPTLALRPAPVQYDQRPGAMLDWFPGSGGFRVTGGLRDGADRSRDGMLRGRLAPYIGLGWQGALLDGRIMVGLDLGALYQGHPDVHLDHDVDAGHPAAAPDTDPAGGETGGGLPFHPIISINLIYRF